jgi:hypothetical protein
MARLRSVALVFGVCLGLSACGGGVVAPADDDEYQFDYDESLVQKWQESSTTLPPYPSDDNLVAARRFPPSTVTLLIDRRAISVGDDRVIRLAYVVESEGGSRNAFFEGFRCGKRQYKSYAYGTAEGGFEPVKQPQWRPIPRSTLNNFRRDLYDNLLCNDFGAPRRPREVFERLDQFGAGDAG